MATVNPWHDLSVGEKAPRIVTAVIEIPKGSSTKYEIDKETGMLALDRFLHSSVHYPGDYGFVPQTLCDDGDALDVVVIGPQPLYPLAVASVRVIGVLLMVDSGENDEKILAVYEKDPRHKEWQDISDMPKHLLAEIKHFFETYKELEGKKSHVRDILPRDEAIKYVERAQQMYREKHGK